MINFGSQQRHKSVNNIEKEFQLSYFKSWKMMLWKCCTQYASKFGKLSSGYRTRKGQFSFQSQRKAMPRMLKLPHTYIHFSCSQGNAQNLFKLGFNNTRTENFQMFKLDLEKAEESEIKVPTSVGSQKKQENSREKHLLLLHWLHWSLWLCGS